MLHQNRCQLFVTEVLFQRLEPLVHDIDVIVANVLRLARLANTAFNLSIIVGLELAHWHRLHPASFSVKICANYVFEVQL